MDTQIIDIHDGVNGYVKLVQHVLRHGKETAPRGMKTREIEDAMIRIEDVKNTLPLGVGRGTVPGIGAVEACQLLAGVSIPGLVIKVGPQFKNYAEDNGIFHGAYGLRTQGQYEKVIQRLKDDPDTRQAVVTIWNPELDLLPQKRDYPCTILHQFRIRDGKLNMTVFMRSNDVWLGAAYDFFQFTRVQLAIASILGIPTGIYTHHVGSLHIYEQHYEKAEALHEAEKYEKVPAITGESWRQIEGLALEALTVSDIAETYPQYQYGIPDFNTMWYSDAMISAIKKNKEKRKENE
jgi:thymidylate synthase